MVDRLGQPQCPHASRDRLTLPLAADRSPPTETGLHEDPKNPHRAVLKLAVAGAVTISIALLYLLPKRYGVQGWEVRTVPVANTVTTDAMGRSVCYRMAAPVPLLTALVVAPRAVDKGEAMRALDLTWSGFIRRDALEAGAVTQGLCGTDLWVTPLYSGPASCLWALRSLIVAFALDRELGLFDTQRAPLPVEKGDYRVTDPTTGWTIAGTRSTGRIELAIAANASADDPVLAPYDRRRRLTERLLHAPRRPDNSAALYGRRSYATDRPLAACPAVSDAFSR